MSCQLNGKKKTQVTVRRDGSGSSNYKKEDRSNHLRKTLQFTLWFDTKLTFADHITKIIEKIEKTGTTLKAYVQYWLP